MQKNAIMCWLVLLLATPAFAQHSETTTHESHFHRNHIAAFVGGTSQVEKKGTSFSLGIDYIRKLPPSGRWGISVFVEAIFADRTEWLFGIPVYFQFYKNMWVRTGPGIEILQEEVEGEYGDGGSALASTHPTTKSKAEFLYRFGVGYEFQVGGLTVAPSLDLDFVRSTTALVWGINIGKGF